jgi:hypothetical protein
MAYKFQKTNGGPIAKADAEAWLEAYKKKHPDTPRGFFFGTDIIEKTLSHPEAVGMRIYLGYDNDKLHAVLIAAREDGSDIWASDSKNGGGQTAADDATPCPPYCP